MSQRQNSKNLKQTPNPKELNLITQFLENQRIELDNNSQEIELKKLNEQHAFEYGIKALEAQKEDRKEQRAQTTLFMKYGFRLTIFVLILISVFVGGCIYTDNINIIISVLKVFAYIFPSAIGGYFIGLNKGKKSSQSNNVSYAEVVED